MIKLFKKHSLVLFFFLSFSFFSCEQLIEIITPTPPKSLSCRLTKANGYGYIYDNTGLLIALSGPTAINHPMKLEYNEKGQISKTITQLDSAVAVTMLYYNEEGKISKTVSGSNHPTGGESTTEYVYSGDKLYVTNTRYHTYTGDTVIVGGYKEVVTFKDGNLVQLDVLPNKFDSIPTQITYEYSQTPNKLYEIKNRLSPILWETDPLISKLLPKRSIWVRDGLTSVTDYGWKLNEQGYPLNNGVNPEVIYEYDCK